MKRLRSNVQLRGAGWSGVLGLIGACACFSWSLATTTTPGVSPSPIQSHVRFSNPFLLPGESPQFPAGGNGAADPNGFTLGDACPGGTIDRQLSALDGIPPYFFSSATAGSVGLNLDVSGHLTGLLTSTGPVADFSATVMDASGASRVGIFELKSQNCGLFHFASDRLASGRVGQDYIAKLDVVGAASAAVQYAVAPGSITLNGAAIPDLESAGFALFTDGTLAGRPLTAGTLAFTATATNNGSRALNHAGTANDQPLMIELLPQSTVTSIMSTRHVSVTGGDPGKDSLQFKALIVTGGFSAKSFTGKPFTLRFGTQIFTTQFGSKADPNFRVSFNNSQGLLQVQLRKQDFSKLLAAAPTGATVRSIVEISLGTVFTSVEVLQLESRSRGGHVQLRFDSAKNTSLGGLFQLSSLQGVNVLGNLFFQANFIISPVGGATISADQATISIGPQFSQTIQLRNNRLPRGIGGINIFALNAKRHTGVLITFAQSPTSVGVSPTATGKTQAFLLRLDLNGASGAFSGVAAEVISPTFNFPIFVPVIIVPVFDDDCFFDDCFDDFSHQLKPRH
jgi:hypothetical protein